MQSALDRRQMILEALSDRRQETVENLAAEFGVSKRTIRYDIEILGCSAPIYTVQGGGGGKHQEPFALRSRAQRRFGTDDGKGILLTQGGNTLGGNGVASQYYRRYFQTGKLVERPT